MSLTLAIDQSTQGTKVMLVQENGTIYYKAACNHKQLISEKGWISHNLNEIQYNLHKLVKNALVNCNGQKIVSVAISNQRETAAAWSRTTGNPLSLAIVWQDNRAKELVKKLSDDHHLLSKVKGETGLSLSPYFTASKWAWLLENVQAVKKARQNNDLCLGTIDTWLVYKLTNGKVYKTEPSNACRTQLMSLKTCQWDSELCSSFGIDYGLLPQIVDSNGYFGDTDLFGELVDTIPIVSVLGDSQAALFAQHCYQPGEYKITFGTGSSIMLNTGDKLYCSDKLNTSVAWKRNGKVTYALEGNVNYSGAIITWLKDNLKIIASPEETDQMAQKANQQDSTILVPSFSGMAVPYDLPNLRAAFTGMTMVTGRNELIKASLDSIIYQIADIIELIKETFPSNISTAHVDGGMIDNRYLMQRLSDMIQQVIQVSPIKELSGLGVALNGKKSNLKLESTKAYMPKINRKESQQNLMRWRRQIRQFIK